MNIGRFTRQFQYSLVGAIVLAGFTPARALAQDKHVHPAAAESSALVQAVRDATERFKDVEVARSEGYALGFGCVSGSDFGAMGMHFINGALIGDDVLDPSRPEILLYEPLPNGRLRLTGADFLVLKDVWDAKHPEGPPQLMGQLLQLFDAPNRFGLPPFYTLHVWAWKENPNGTFVNWNPNVSCDAFSGE